jgi:hypothetical protein
MNKSNPPNAVTRQRDISESGFDWDGRVSWEATLRHKDAARLTLLTLLTFKISSLFIEDRELGYQ